MCKKIVRMINELMMAIWEDDGFKYEGVSK